MPTRRELSTVLRILKNQYHKYREPASLEWLGEPFKVLMSCIISLRTKDEVTTPAARRLFRLAKTPKKMVKVPVAKIRKAIYPAGFYKTKAKRLKEMSKQIIDEYGGVVPYRMDDLLRLKGVGRKTANIVISYGYGCAGIAVDVHVHRIPNRLGWIKTKNPEETEYALMELFPRKDWNVLNDLFVMWGQNVCKPVAPKCFECKINKYCKKIGVKERYWKKKKRKKSKV